MIIKNNEELRRLTSSWYASNDFERIKQDIELETEELAKIVGDDVIDLAESIASKSDPTPDEQKLWGHVALPIALMAVYRFGQSNLVSHDQSTRLVKIDKENETMPWEWMIDRDDAAHLAKAQRAVDRLIAFLDKEAIPEWVNSDKKRAAKGLFVYNTELFSQYYPIIESARFFYMSIPLLKEVQVTKIKDALGSDYKTLLESMQDNAVPESMEDLLDIVRRAQVLATIALAVRRLSIHVLPDGLVKAIKAEQHTLNAKNPVSPQDVRFFEMRITEDAEKFIDKIRRERNKQHPDRLEYQLLPNNDPKKKYAST